jgi:hypothetical protein
MWLELHHCWNCLPQMRLFQSFSKKIELTMTVDVAQGIKCCCILNHCMRITLFPDHLLYNQLQRIFDKTHGEPQKIESVKTRTSKSLTKMRTR